MPCKWHLLRQLSSVQSFHFLQASVYSIYTLSSYHHQKIKAVKWLTENENNQRRNPFWWNLVWWEAWLLMLFIPFYFGRDSHEHLGLWQCCFRHGLFPHTMALKIHTVFSFSHTVFSFCAVTDEATVWTLALCYAACELLALLFLFIQISALVLFWKADLQISSNLSYLLIRCSFNRELRKRDKQAQCGINIITDVERLRIVQYFRSNLS